jgi:hypothetical protein
LADRADCEAAAVELREFAMELERSGHPREAIADAMLTVGMTSAKRLGGARSLAGFLEEMGQHYREEANESECAEYVTTH